MFILLVDQWEDLDMLVHSIEKIPNIYIEYGNYMSDVLAVESLLEQIKRKESFVIVRKTNWIEHTVDDCLSEQTIKV